MRLALPRSRSCFAGAKHASAERSTTRVDLVQLESVASLGQGACSHAKAAADQGPYVEKL
jgi:hypothetical protein